MRKLLASAFHPLHDLGDSLLTHPFFYGTSAILCLCLGGFVVAPMSEYYRAAPAIQIISASKAQGITNGNGGYLPLRINVKRPLNCELKFTRVVWRWKPGTDHVREIFHIDFDGVGNPFGEDEYQVDFPILIHLPPGDWNYTAFSQKKCPIWDWWFPSPPRQSPDTPVTVAPDLALAGG